MNPLISVVIPALNEEKYLPKILKDLIKQTDHDFEVVIADGNSDDNTQKKALLHGEKLNLKIVNCPRRNLAFQRNFGAKNASGTYVQFLDADMRVNKNFIKDLKSHINKHNYFIYLPLHIPDSSLPPDELLYKLLSFFTEASHLTEKPFSYGPAALFNRGFFEALGGYDETVFVYEDHEIVQRARKRGVHAKLLPHVEVLFSTRRFKKEGRLSVLSKYLLASMHLIAHGKVDKEIFNYQMGGSAQYLLEKNKKEDFGKKINKYFDKLKLILEE